MDLGLSGRTALICGSSSGIGKAIAAALAAEGARVVLNGRDQARLDRAAEDLEPVARFPITRIVADVAIPEEAARLVQQAEQAGPDGLAILVCNAGGPPAGSVEELPEEAWQRGLDLNLLSTVHLCRAAVPLMQRRGWGRLLCVTSVAAKQPMAGLILSTTARAGVLGFAKSLSDEIAGSGVTVNVLCPGYIATERLEELARDRAERSGRSPQQILAEMGAAVPVGRIGEPRELAWAAAFLVSEPARYITGTAISVDGGLTRSIL